MINLSILRITNLRADDHDKNDELLLTVKVDQQSPKAFRQQLMQDEHWTLNRTFQVQQQASILLRELGDEEGEEDKLMVAFDVNSRHKKGVRERRFKRGNAVYEITYRVDQGIGEPKRAKPGRVAVKGKKTNTGSKTQRVPVDGGDKASKDGRVQVGPTRRKNQSADRNRPADVTDFSNRVTRFRPSVHGMPFRNRFKINFNIKLPFIPKIASNYGLCGGMSLMAADCFKHGNLPKMIAEPPKTGTPMYNHLFKRQLESFGTNGKNLATFFQWWMMLSTMQTQQKTLKELEKVKAKIDSGGTAPLGLVYVDEKSGKLWENHQVLAFDYEEASDRKTYVRIYDPNYPGRDDLFLQCEKENVQTAVKSVDRIATLQVIPNVRTRDVRGFFHTNIKVEAPPGDLVRRDDR